MSPCAAAHDSRKLTSPSSLSRRTWLINTSSFSRTTWLLASGLHSSRSANANGFSFTWPPFRNPTYSSLCWIRARTSEALPFFREGCPTPSAAATRSRLFKNHSAPEEVSCQASVGLLIPARLGPTARRSEEHTSELQSLAYLVCSL